MKIIFLQEKYRFCQIHWIVMHHLQWTLSFSLSQEKISLSKLTGPIIVACHLNTEKEYMNIIVKNDKKNNNLELLNISKNYPWLFLFLDNSTITSCKLNTQNQKKANETKQLIKKHPDFNLLSFSSIGPAEHCAGGSLPKSCNS